MAWFWQNKGAETKKKSTRLTNEQIKRLKRLGDDFTKFMGAGQRNAGAVPTILLEKATRAEIRAGLIENLIDLLQRGFSFEQQIKIMENMTAIFLAMNYFDIQIAGGNRKIESDTPYQRSLDLWDEFQDLITRDGGKRFEVNEDEIREKIVIKLIEET